MTLEGALFSMLPMGLGISWVVTIVLVWGAFHRPVIRSLVYAAILSSLISLTISWYVLAVVNAAGGYLVAREVVQIIGRLLFLAFIVLQVWFIYLFVSGGFRDGGSL